MPLYQRLRTVGNRSPRLFVAAVVIPRIVSLVWRMESSVLWTHILRSRGLLRAHILERLDAVVRKDVFRPYRQSCILMEPAAYTYRHAAQTKAALLPFSLTRMPHCMPQSMTFSSSSSTA